MYKKNLRCSFKRLNVDQSLKKYNKVNCEIYTYTKCHLMEDFMKILHFIEFVQQIYTPKFLAFTVNKQLYLSPLFFLQLFIYG